MTASVRILTAPSLDSNPSLVIISPDGSKTLVNCGEGCQRSFLESSSSLRVGSVGRVCLTHLGHDSLGGLPGMILTTADVAAAAAAHSIARGDFGNNNGNGGGVGGGHGGGDRRRRPPRRNDDNNGGNGNGNGNGTNNNGRNRKRGGGGPSYDRDDGESGGDVPDLEIVGPDGTGACLRSLRHFMRRDRFKVHAREGRYDSSSSGPGGGGGGADASSDACPAAARKKNKRQKKKQKFGNNNGRNITDGREIRFRVRSMPVLYDAGGHHRPGSSSPAATRRQAVSYLFTTPPIPGKFLVDRARELNVPAGPMYGQLKAGKSVTFVDPDTGEERTVTSGEVVEKSSPGAGVAVIYCPSLEVLEKLGEEEQPLRAFYEDGGGGPGNGDAGSDPGEGGAAAAAALDVMVHLTPRRIFDDPAYRAWCGKFGAVVDHIALHAVDTLESRAAAVENSPFVSGMCGGARRSFVNGELFPMPSLVLPGGGGGEDHKAEPDSERTRTIRGVPMMEYVLMPRSRRGLNESTTGGMYPTDAIDNARRKVEESGAAESASAIVPSVVKEGEAPSQGTVGGGLGELIFTGTGSAIPCKHRNVTGMYLRMDNGNGMLLDVGEGTVGQLLRSWQSTLPNGRSPVEEYRSRLGGIKAVWISHPHADHHLGLLRLLSERAAICGPDDPLVLMAPRDMFAFLAEYRREVPEIDGSYVAVDCFDMVHGRDNPMGKRLHDELGITRCFSVPVAHCPRSFAVSISGTSFGTVAYSGDCRPSNRFADASLGADLLIHEATFEDGMEVDAALKRHCTVGEAIGVASRMGAKSLVLTHFSQRYPKIPPLNRVGDNAEEIPIAFAFDFMRLTPGTMKLAAKLTPALRLLYPREGGEEVESEEVDKVSAKELMAVPGVFAVKGVL